MHPRKITIEILTNDQTNNDPILALLEACRWLSLSYGNSTSENNTTEIVMHVSKHGPRVDVQTCRVCGKYQPLTPIVCFGCISKMVRAALESVPE